MDTINTDTLDRGSLADFITLLRDHHVRRHDVVAPAQALTMNDEGGLEVHAIELDMDLERGVGEQETVTTYDVNDLAMRQLLTNQCGIPTKYVNRMRDDIDANGALLATNANHWLADDARSYLLRALQVIDPTDGQAEYVLRAVLSNGYKVMDDLDVTLSVLDALRTSDHVDPANLNITCSRSAHRMYMRIVSPDVQVEAPDITARYRDPRTGRDGREYPIVSAGVEITNSEVGMGSWSLCPYVELQVCSNGMKRRQDLMRSVHLGERLDDGVVKWSDDTQTKTLELVKAKTTDAITTFLTPGYLQSVIDDMRELHVQLVDPKRQVEEVTKQMRFNESQADAILTSFLAAGDHTALGVGQAITNVAHDVDPDAAYELENVAWKAMEVAAATV